MIKVSKKFMRTLLSGVLAFQILPLAGCSSQNSDEGYTPTEYAAGEHQLIEVDRSFNMLAGKNGLYGLIAPEGYAITDYDYDKTDVFEYNDYVYENVVPVTVKNPNNIGIPVENVEEQDDIYETGEHVLVDIDRSFNILIGKDDQVFHLFAPAGYSVLDYDYDKTDAFEFENVTYVNNQAVRVDDINQFGEPVEKVDEKDSTNTYDVGEDMMVVIHRGFNPFFGKNEMKEVESIPGYKVIDYDYDKTDSFEFETIVYQNVVPVTVANDGEIGVPSVSVESEEHSDGYYDTGEHVLVDINRNVNILSGYDGTKQISSIDGYTVLDYDYDKNDSFEFETFVYVNDQPVEVQNSNEFGKVYQKTRD